MIHINCMLLYYKFALLTYITYHVQKMITREHAGLVKIMAFCLHLSIRLLKRQMLHNLELCHIAIYSVCQVITVLKLGTVPLFRNSITIKKALKI